MPEGLLQALGGEAGCQQLSAQFYARVAKDPLLRPLFPGTKGLRCATEEFAAFLIQFLGGDENQTQSRWWLSLRESHARFKITPAARSAWLKHMEAALQSIPVDDQTRDTLHQFFLHSSRYVIGQKAPKPHQHDSELTARWHAQLAVDDLISAIAAGHDDHALALAPQFAARPSVYVGILARMLQSGRTALTDFAIQSVESDPSLTTHRFAGRTLLHSASATGCTNMVALLLRLGTDPNIEDRGRHTPLYSVANECAAPDSGPAVVRLLVQAGANVNACAGVTRSTPLHMAARRGHLEIAQALLECGAALDALDRKGDTPLQRAINCRRQKVAQFLAQRDIRS